MKILNMGIKVKEKYNKIRLDKQQLEETITIIFTSMEFHLEVVITYFDQHKPYIMVGHIRYVNPHTQQFIVEDRFNQYEHISIKDVIDIRIQK
ncbi:YolD-like family protein [Bacillus sp. 1P06AnD]|uniref:YolD-like family protein n=1 Tax=Bacillus sp. 1P06AnD TaxID=3132208 RepID=UPI0039A06119